jgi:hypothetical protein
MGNWYTVANPYIWGTNTTATTTAYLVNYGSANPAAVAPSPLPAVAPKKADPDPVRWLRGRVDEITELAFAA